MLFAPSQFQTIASVVTDVLDEIHSVKWNCIQHIGVAVLAYTSVLITLKPYAIIYTAVTDGPTSCAGCC